MASDPDSGWPLPPPVYLMTTAAPGGAAAETAEKAAQPLFRDGSYKTFPLSMDQENSSTGLPAVCAFAPYKRFRPRRKPWRSADSLRPSILISQGIQKNNHTFRCGCFFGASDEARTRYLHLGKVALYQMSYTRNSRVYNSRFSPHCQHLFLFSSAFRLPAPAIPCAGPGQAGSPHRGTRSLRQEYPAPVSSSSVQNRRSPS
jgi:hypothetical protein